MANQNDAVMQFVQDLAKTLQTDPNEVIQIAQQNPEALKSAVEVFQQTQDIQQAAQAFQQSLQQQVQAAKHGAKLQYLKSLKNKCAEDEELYYFKKGGSIGCGCKKKEEGGKVTKTPEKNSSIERFKNRPRTKEEQAKIDKLSEQDYLSYKSKVSESNDGRTPQQKAQKMKVEKKSKGSKMKLLERGSKCPKCGKVHSAGMGCSVAEFKKKFEKGGSLKHIPFMQQGTNKFGIRSQSEIDSINQQNRNNAKGMFNGMVSGEIVPTLPNIGRMVSSAYKGWLDPETPYQTGIAPTPSKTRNIGEILQKRADLLRDLKRYRKLGFTWEDIGPKWQSFWNKYGGEPW